MKSAQAASPLRAIGQAAGCAALSLIPANDHPANDDRQQPAASQLAILHANPVGFAEPHKSLERKERSACQQRTKSARPSIYVRPDRLSRLERHHERFADKALLTKAATFLETRGWQFAYCVLRGTREELRAFKSRLMDILRIEGIPRRYWLEVLESETGLHGNIIVAGTPDAVRKIARLAERGKFSGLAAGDKSAKLHVQITRSLSWFSRRTSEGPGYGQKGLLRADITGSKVRLSGDLKKDLARAGKLVRPRRYANRKRLSEVKLAPASEIRRMLPPTENV